MRPLFSHLLQELSVMEVDVSFQYMIFGLKVQSDWLLWGFPTVFNQPDIHIQWSEAGVESRDERPEGLYRIDDSRHLLSVPGVGRYMIIGGTRIVVEEAPGSNRQDVLLYLLGSAFGFLMMQRGVFPLHGSAVNHRGKGIVIVGDSGAGKSSLAAALSQKGAWILTDDVARWEHGKEGARMFPSYPAQKLWAATAQNLGVSLAHGSPMAYRTDKYTISSQDRFANTPIALDAVVVLSVGDGADVGLKTMSRKNGLDALIRHTYRYEYLNLFGAMGSHFESVVKLSDRVPVFQLQRPIGSFTLEQQIAQLDTHIIGGV